MMNPLTDALRIQAVCDFQEGTDSSHLLQKAQPLGLLPTDREMPLPHSFIEMPRRMGSAFELVAPPGRPGTDGLSPQITQQALY